MFTSAQKLIQKQFPHLDELQSPLLSQGDQFLPMVDEGAQIHHVGNHWETSTSTGGKITVYDSYYSYKLSTPLCHQLALLYNLLGVRASPASPVLAGPLFHHINDIHGRPSGRTHLSDKRL